MMKKPNQIVTGLTCLIFTMVVLLVGPGITNASAAGVSKPSGPVNSPIEPLPLVIIGALVLFAGLIIYDIIAHPYVEKSTKDAKGKKNTIHTQKTTPTDKVQPQSKPAYSTDYDYLLGVNTAQKTAQFPGKVLKVKSTQ